MAVVLFRGRTVLAAGILLSHLILQHDASVQSIPHLHRLYVTELCFMFDHHRTKINCVIRLLQLNATRYQNSLSGRCLHISCYATPFIHSDASATPPPVYSGLFCTLHYLSCSLRYQTEGLPRGLRSAMPFLSLDDPPRTSDLIPRTHVVFFVV